MSTTSPPSVIISDTSCLILLSKIGRLEQLRQLFGQCLITLIIAAEFGRPLPGWLLVRAPRQDLPANIGAAKHHAGERSALALALETPDSLLILDDAPARQLATALNLTYTGTLGLIVLGKVRGFIPLVRPVLIELQSVGLWTTAELLERLCREAGE